MARGPLPNPASRRRNAPTIPATVLPAGGYDGPIPTVPASYQLRDAGTDWWNWAWRTPQAAAFGTGSLYALARRAQLEDDLAALARVDDFSIEEILGLEDEREIGKELEFLIGRLKRMAGGSVSLMKEMRELDKRFGFDPKALAENRWTIVEPEPDKEDKPAEVRTLRAVG